MTPAEKLRDPAVFASTASLCVFDMLGYGAMEWEPETIRAELRDTYGVDVDSTLSDKINAGMALLSSDLYHKSLEAFTTINAAFNLRPISSNDFNVNTLDEVMWGVVEASLLEGPDDFFKAGFSHDIGRYVGELLSMEGCTKPPKALSFAEFEPSELDKRDILLSSDPIAAEAYWRRQEGISKELSDMASGNVAELLKDIGEVAFKHGDVSGAADSAGVAVKDLLT